MLELLLDESELSPSLPSRGLRGGGNPLVATLFPTCLLIVLLDPNLRRPITPGVVFRTLPGVLLHDLCAAGARAGRAVAVRRAVLLSR